MSDTQALPESTVVARFAALFAGNVRVYGTYDRISLEREDGKLKGQARTVFAPVTTELYAAHLAGTNGLGVVPIRDDSTCSFGTIDIDVYTDLDHATIAQGLKGLGLPLVPCRSKSGGCHIYLFTATPVPAARLRAYLKDVAVLIGHGNAEIFPKQSVLSSEPNSSGSWINLPFYSGDAGTRCAFAPDGHVMTVAEFLDHAESCQVKPEALSKPVSSTADFEDGPPCLQALAASGGCSSGERNRGLFAMGVYLRKAHPDNYGALLDEYNQRYMHQPLLSEELVQIKKSVGKKVYNYSCGEEPLVSRCNAAVCRFRKYGIGGDSTPMPQFGILKKIETNPPTYTWELDGTTVDLLPDELLTYRAFRRAVFMSINVLLPLMKEAKWPELLSPALAQMEIVPMPEDASPDGQMWEHVKTFCTGRAHALQLDEVTMGKPYKSEDGFYCFRLGDLMAHIGRSHLKVPQSQTLAAILRRRGGKHQVKKLRGKTTNLWVFSVTDIEQEVDDPLPIPDSIANAPKY